jgi:hypothetical protein
MMKNLVLTAFILFIALQSEQASAATLDLSAGTWSLGGRFAVPYKYDRVGRSSLSFKEDPEFSYFVADNLRLIASVELELSTQWSRIRAPTTQKLFWGGKLGVEYVFDLGGSIYPFAGVKFGARVERLVFDQTQTLVEFPVGILWAMNDHVALSFAVPVEVAFTKFFTFEDVKVVPGYFGIVGFF